MCIYSISLRYVPYMITGSLHIPYKNNDHFHYAHPDSRTLQTINRTIIQTSWLHDYLQSKKTPFMGIAHEGDIRQPSSEDNKKLICVVLYIYRGDTCTYIYVYVYYMCVFLMYYNIHIYNY